MIKKIRTNQPHFPPLSLSPFWSIEIKCCSGGLIGIEDKQTFLSMAINGAAQVTKILFRVNLEEMRVILLRNGHHYEVRT